MAKKRKLIREIPGDL